MKHHINYKLIILVFIPLILGLIFNYLMGYAINSSSSLVNIAQILIYLWSIGEIVYWFWVGRQFGKLKMKRIKSFIFGNVIWGICLVIFIWQFIFLNDVSRNFFIAGIPQHYVLGFISLSSLALRFITRTINSTVVILIAFFIMLLVFIGGFRGGSKNKELG